jgi:hypothetical protein
VKYLSGEFHIMAKTPTKTRLSTEAEFITAVEQHKAMKKDAKTSRLPLGEGLYLNFALDKPTNFKFRITVKGSDRYLQIGHHNLFSFEKARADADVLLAKRTLDRASSTDTYETKKAQPKKPKQFVFPQQAGFKTLLEFAKFLETLTDSRQGNFYQDPYKLAAWLQILFPFCPNEVVIAKFKAFDTLNNTFTIYGQNDKPIKILPMTNIASRLINDLMYLRSIHGIDLSIVNNGCAGNVLDKLSGEFILDILNEKNVSFIHEKIAQTTFRLFSKKISLESIFEVFLFSIQQFSIANDQFSKSLKRFYKKQQPLSFDEEYHLQILVNWWGNEINKNIDCFLINSNANQWSYIPKNEVNFLTDFNRRISGTTNPSPYKFKLVDTEVDDINATGNTPKSAPKSNIVAPSKNITPTSKTIVQNYTEAKNTLHDQDLFIKFLLELEKFRCINKYTEESMLCNAVLLMILLPNRILDIASADYIDFNWRTRFWTHRKTPLNEIECDEPMTPLFKSTIEDCKKFLGVKNKPLFPNLYNLYTGQPVVEISQLIDLSISAFIRMFWNGDSIFPSEFSTLFKQSAKKYSAFKHEAIDRYLDTPINQLLPEDLIQRNALFSWWDFKITGFRKKRNQAAAIA